MRKSVYSVPLYVASEVNIHLVFQKSPENLTPTDPYLTNLKPANATALCLWRRSLIAATEFTKILLPSFAKRLSVEVPVARGLLNRLEKEGFVKAAGRGR